MILGFDPGRDKCGIAIGNSDRKIYLHQTIASGEAIAYIDKSIERWSIELIVMGNLTTAKDWYRELRASFASLTIEMIDEQNSTLEARDRYWQMYPPQGLQKLIPQGLRTPPRPIDDIVAILLIERYLSAEGKHSNT